MIGIIAGGCQMRARWVIAATTAIFAVTAHAQAGPVFEVSPATPDSRVAYSRTPRRTPQILSFEAASLPDLIAFAYELLVDPSEGRPQWTYNSRYDVAVTTTDPTSLQEQRRLLQKLLEERFGLVTRRVSYRIPAYFLVQGPKVNLTASQEREEVSDFCSRKRRDAIAALGADQLRSLLQDSAPCVAPTSMSGLAGELSKGMQATVLDKTGISGLFDIEFGAGAPPSSSLINPADNLPVLCIPGRGEC